MTAPCCFGRKEIEIRMNLDINGAGEERKEKDCLVVPVNV
jgi:hypothetical protein